MIYFGEKWPANWASEANIQYTQEQNFYLCWGSKWPKNWASEAHILHTFKSTCNEHVKQYWYETSENVWESDLTPEFWLTWVQNGLEIGILRPTLYTSVEVAPTK